MLRLRIQDLIDRINRDHRTEGQTPLHIRDVAEELGIVRTTLSNMTTFTGERATNTRIVEALIRYFSREIPRFDFRDLFEFSPEIGGETGLTAADLYPEWSRNRATQRPEE